MIRRPPRSTLDRSSAASDVYKRQVVLDVAKLGEYAGDYRSDEAEVTQTWRVEKGQLVVYAGYRRLGILEPTYKDGFTRGGSVIDVVRDAKGRITGYVVASGPVS